MKQIVLGTLLAACLVAPAFAKEVAGVQVPETVTVQNTPLLLNGAGVRTRFFVKVYVGALYLKNRETAAPGVFSLPPPKSVRIHVLRELSSEQLNDALYDGLNNNHTPAEMDALQPRIKQLRELVPAVRRGDVVSINMLADGATELTVNDQRRGAIPGADFQAALLKIWLGDKPVDKSLKQAMLGQD